MPDAALITAYCRTTYRIHPAAGPMGLRLGVFHEGFNRWLMEQRAKRWVLLTAFNPGSQQQSHGANETAQRQLAADVADAGWTVYPAESVADDADWPIEPQLLILGMAPTAAEALARRYGQTALVTGELNQSPRLRLTAGKSAIAALNDLIAAADPLVAPVAAETLAAILGYIPSQPNRHFPVLVYGTLKRGECRQQAWPHAPLKAETAWTQGWLFDLGSYPALTEGADQVHGELWHLADGDLPETLAVLDAIEGFSHGGPDDLYHRRIIACSTSAGARVAYTYYYARPGDLRVADRVMPRDDVVGVTWPCAKM